MSLLILLLRSKTSCKVVNETDVKSVNVAKAIKKIEEKKEMETTTSERKKGSYK
jgi:hypothetical protein